MKGILDEVFESKQAWISLSCAICWNFPSYLLRFSERLGMQKHGEWRFGLVEKTQQGMAPR